MSRWVATILGRLAALAEDPEQYWDERSELAWN